MKSELVKCLLLVTALGCFIPSLTIGFANQHVRFGSDFRVEVDNRGIGQESMIRVITDPEKMKGQELSVSVQSPERETVVRTVVPFSEDGIYELPIVFDQTGEWGMWMRYGLGLENYERIRRFEIGDEAEVVQAGSSTFRNYFLRPDVPDYVQPMGYAIFGTLLLCTLLMLARLFYWLNNKHRNLTS